jgi:hypothetical protein
VTMWGHAERLRMNLGCRISLLTIFAHSGSTFLLTDYSLQYEY